MCHPCYHNAKKPTPSITKESGQIHRNSNTLSVADKSATATKTNHKTPHTSYPRASSNNAFNSSKSNTLAARKRSIHEDIDEESIPNNKLKSSPMDITGDRLCFPVKHPFIKDFLLKSKVVVVDEYLLGTGLRP
jgi:hypothetical protein